MSSAGTIAADSFPSSWTKFADQENLHPIRDELLGADYLQTHARKLGGLMRSTSIVAGRPLPDEFARNAKMLRDAHRTIADAYRNHEALGNDAEWLLDNYHIIHDALAEIRTDLPNGYYHRLPKVAAGPLLGYPRVYALALELTAHCDSSLEEASIVQFVQAFQEEAPLTIGELWAVPIMLRVCLIENLRRLAQHILHFRSFRQRAKNWIEGKLPALKAQPGPDGFELNDIHCDWRDCYLVHLLEGLHDHSAIHPEGIERLEKSLSAEKDTPADVLRREKERQAANQVSIGNSVTTLRLLSALDWTKFFETTSHLEALLRNDPAGVYARQDFATRDRYRSIIEKLAYRSKVEELGVAHCVLHFAEVSPASEPRQRHIGYYLIDEGLPELEAALNHRASIAAWVPRTMKAHPNATYFGGLGTLVLAALCVLAWMSFVLDATPLLIAILLGTALIPIVGISVEVVNFLVVALLSPRTLPALELKGGVPADCATFIVIPTLLTSEAGAAALVERLEIHYLANSEKNAYFALLSDFSDASAEQMPDDAAVLNTAMEAIRNLNDKYASGTPLFFLLHRRRQWNAAQGRWMGWERKRGKLAEFNRLLRGAQDTSFTTVDDDWSTLPKIRFVITLDSDTQLPRETARRLIATLAHPLNQPVFDAAHKRVVRGYAILQPRIGLSLRGAGRSLFARLFSGSAGIDPYTTAVSDTYQDLFGSGSFTGKGIYDVDAFESALGHTFPDNRILSHDLIEGNYARCGLVTNIELLDDFPANYLAYVRRDHRWVRGDWQILAWLFPRVPTSDGTRAANPLPLLERWKILDNLRRSLMPIALVMLLFLGWTVLPGASWAWTALAGLILANALLLQLLDRLAGCVEALLKRRQVTFAWKELGSTAGQVALASAFLATHAHSALDAILRTLARLWFTRRNLLEWETAASTERRLDGSLPGFFVAMWSAPATAIGVGTLVAMVRPEALLPAAPFLIAWLLSPLLAFAISRPRRKKQSSLPIQSQGELRRLARKTWAFFETFVGADDHWLPPDNYQEDPKGEIAHRTSPTNIGLYLLSCVAAHDLGFLTLPTLLDRLEKTFATMDRMEHSHGHLYNWYDTQKLEPLQPLYLSTVDSGNLVACLLTLKQSLLEKIDAPIIGTAALHGLQDVAALLKESIRVLEQPGKRGTDEVGAAFEPLLRLLRPTLKTPPHELTEWNDRLHRLASEQADLLRKIEQLNAELGEVPHDLRQWMTSLAELTQTRIQEATGIRQCLAEPLALNRLSLGQLAALQPSAAHETNGTLRHANAAWAGDLAGRCRELAERADAVAAAMDFKILYNSQRNLFAVGFNQSTGRLDGSHYDLLASEASLTSFLAIARREVPRKHWFHLGRPLTSAGGNRVLISWGGTMFEYLMPRLLLLTEPETLIGESTVGAVAAQIAYGRQCGTPWGISESAFSMVDGQLNYQYQAFGAPALGLKRGLGKDLVVAPYATGLAFMVEPQQALNNLRRLHEEGAEGTFGWYEAIDYTAERLPKGKRSVMVKCYMAHHQGMTLLGLANCLLGNPMPRRLRAEPMVRATELLLQERVPTGVPLSELQPQEAVQTTFHEIPTQMSRRVTTPHTALPRTHILASSQCSVMVTASGSGFSTARGLALTRWREDTACDWFGQFYYLRDVSTGRTWSAGYQPIAKEADAYEVTFSTDKVEFRRRDGKLETHMEITVAPDHHAEVRRITIFNHDDRSHEVELTSYIEVVLLPQAADVAHPAFGKLFLETEFVPSSGALLCRRRPRAPEQKPIWCIHVLAADGAPVAPIQFETDRVRFLGRGRTPASPAALEPGARPLSGTVGPVLDPILSLRRRFRLAAGASVHVAFTTGLADTREEALAFADAGKDLHCAQRAFEFAWAHTQVELRQQHWTAAETHLFQRLAAHLLFAGKALREAPANVAKNRQGQMDLWRIGISGDLPIMLIRIANAEELTLARQVVAAHTFWRLKGLAVDLVILNEEGGSYFEELDKQLQVLVRASDDRARIDKPGGVFLRKSAHLGFADLLLLQAVARCVLVGSRGLLGVQLDRLERVRTSAAPNVARQAKAKPFPIKPRRVDSLPSLQFDNGIGGFSQDGHEYVLRLAEKEGRRVLPPQPWVNVIANPQFGFVVSESGGGFTWADNSQSNRLTPWQNDPVSDPIGEVVYLCDDAAGEWWSTTPQPCGAGADFTVRHGQGYTIFALERSQLDCQLTLFVSKDEPIKFFKLNVRNVGSRSRRLSAIFYAELVLGTHRGQTAAHVVTDIDAETEALIARNLWNADFKDKIAFADVNQRPRQVTGDRTEFIGRNGNLGAPAACVRGQLSGTVGACLDPCAALRTTWELRPQEEKEIVFVLGEANGMDEARRLVRMIQDSGQVQARLDAVRAFWDQFTSGIAIRTPDAALDLLVNRWLPYQVLSCRMWARSALYQSGGAYGFRDQLQDCLALVYARPDETRRQILRAAARQFVEGDVQHWWHPPGGAGVRTRISDDLLWLPFAVYHYVVVTGDRALLDETVEFMQAPLLAAHQDEDYRRPEVAAQSATVYEHCLRALQHAQRFGVHDLPLMGTGDWNDGMNCVGVAGKGESVWLGWFLLTVLTQFSELCEERRDAPHAADFRELARRLRSSLELNAWDGQWYRRAYFDDGRPLGSAANDECRIDSLPQSWAVISGAGEPQRARIALEAVNSQLVRRDEKLVLLFAPPFDQGELQPGYIKGYVPGIRENGGQYTHAALWLAQAWALLDDGDRALEILDMINPIHHTINSDAVQRYRLEPYVLAADVYGKPPHEGRGGWSWYTGSASWYFRVVIESLFGFELRGSRFRLTPRLPSGWPSAELTFRFKSSTYRIRLERSDKTTRSLDGMPWPDDAFPLTDDGKEHTVVLTAPFAANS